VYYYGHSVLLLLLLIPAMQCAGVVTYTRDVITQAPGKTLASAQAAATSIRSAAVNAADWLAHVASATKTWAVDAARATKAAISRAYAWFVGGLHAMTIVALNAVLLVGSCCLSIWEAAKVLLMLKTNTKVSPCMTAQTNSSSCLGPGSSCQQAGCSIRAMSRIH
jgi:hypothetical protein